LKQGARLRPSGLTILHKIVGLIVALVAVLVGTLAIYFSVRQVSEFRETLANKATTYGRFLSKQLGPAIAFDDRQTAREVFDAVAEDPDVVAMAIFHEGGEALETRGTLTPSTLAMVKAGSVLRVSMTDERVIVIEPVASREGPRGTLALELSTQSLEAARQKAIWVSSLLGACGLFIGSIAAWLIGRSLARRLRTIADVATAVAAGDLETKPVSEPGTDEIGVMAQAFNAMLAQLRSLISHIQENAKEEQQRLEKLVSERTRALDRRNTEMRLLLDNADQGFLTIDRDAIISRERSAAVDKWLAPFAEGISFGACLDRLVPRFGEAFAANWSQVVDEELPLELTLGQLPRSFDLGTRHFTLDYRSIVDEKGLLDKVLVVISDLTSAIERDRAEQDQREITSLFGKALEDLSGLAEFVEETGRLIDEISASPPPPAVVLKRLVHTLKGNAATFGVQTMAEICHDIESTFVLDKVHIRPEDEVRLRSRWQSICSKIGAIAPTTRQAQVDDAEHDALLFAVDHGASRQDIRQTLLSWKLEPVEVRFKRIAAQIESLVERLGKGAVDVHIEANRIRLPLQRFASFWSTFSHVVRNAVDHGIESPEERRRSGKPATAVLRLRAFFTDQVLSIEIADSGPGINWSEVRRAAIEGGLPHASREDLIEALFADGLTTRAEATETSGRGVGLGALREACCRSGGDVEVWTEEGVGTSFRFVWPRSIISPDIQPSLGQANSGYLWTGEEKQAGAGVR
jgi:two-component system chemotaxis sensor kinase CheA